MTVRPHLVSQEPDTLPGTVQRYQRELSQHLEELREQQAATEQALAWFASLFEALPVPVLLLSDVGTVVEANGSAVDYLGLSRPLPRAPLMLRRLLEGRDADLRWVNALAHARTQGEATLEEQALKPGNGGARVARIVLRRVDNAEAAVRGVALICSLIDLTAQVQAREAEQARQAAESRQRDAETRSQARAQTLSRVSHELRTPLNAIMGFAQLLTADLDHLPAEHRPYLAHIRAAGADLLGLVEEVLDINRAESGQLKLDMVAVTLADEVHAAVALNRAEAQALDMRIDSDVGEAPRVRADARRVREILINLLSNAIKYGRHGGAVRLRCGHDEHDAWIEVEDNGIGIAAELLPQLFEPFNRLGSERSRIKGHGLGLSICKSYAEQMGGRLTARSEPGQGSCFTLTLPRWDRGRG
ncbi:PAS domain-containing sensor histidine kinase [Ideonella sp. 4Y16]|uniref:PAS domain-containing sensor histidine kinase n=1 Tax=Ideonella alba TaxID=2824118 RepID=UPI001B397DC4|nr:PAS domain-containing sensor histidine kinase [Ideonella alba]MBQ0943681.1 PAS domain-containing sensor histidine kinase [Ideonella alba]